ncbi:hypothetical protein PR048_033470 [Dryococelus australis]|uniref:Uncharacterized protein n=1 Tax=Dryococelus australis TaxID=614101 RepID=A0ABQ9G3G5_9NEOP|nr:hypothetical protein PR048_033470 [Dryococelus australis]
MRINPGSLRIRTYVQFESSSEAWKSRIAWKYRRIVARRCHQCVTERFAVELLDLCVWKSGFLLRAPRLLSACTSQRRGNTESLQNSTRLSSMQLGGDCILTSREETQRLDARQTCVCQRRDRHDDQQVLRTDDGEARWVWSSAEMKGGRKREIPEKTRRPAATPCTILPCENPGGAALLGIEPGSGGGGGSYSSWLGFNQWRNQDETQTAALPNVHLCTKMSIKMWLTEQHIKTTTSNHRCGALYDKDHRDEVCLCSYPSVVGAFLPFLLSLVACDTVTEFIQIRHRLKGGSWRLRPTAGPIVKGTYERALLDIAVLRHRLKQGHQRATPGVLESAGQSLTQRVQVDCLLGFNVSCTCPSVFFSYWPSRMYGDTTSFHGTNEDSDTIRQNVHD